MKKDILSGLPEKHEEKVPHEMTPLQIESYNEALFRLSEHRAEQAKTQGFVLATLQRLRDISDHPYLGERNESFFELSTCDSLISVSAKLIITIDILNNIRKKQEKVIIFTPRRGVQLLLRRILLEKFDIPLEYVSIINGDTPASSIGRNGGQISRQDAVDAFQSRPGFQTIIMSPLAAGFGLNIAGANHVIHYTRHWNPAKENQATDRVYRIGQKKEVFVYYPLATGIGFRSFDEILDERLQMKIDLASQTLFPTEQVEVTPADLLGELEKEGVQTKNSAFRQVLQEEIDYMDPFLVEALVALLWEKQGFQTYLTPKSSDYGADVVAIKDLNGILFQVKQSSGSVKDTAVGEILKAKSNYQNQFKCEFSLSIITNGKFSEQAYSLAQNNYVGIYDREAFFSILDRFPVTWQDVYQKETQRMT